MSELQRLQDRIAELENVLGLTARFPGILPGGIFRTRACDQLLGLLMARTFVSHQSAYEALYGDRSECDQPTTNIIAVTVCWLRKGLKPYDIFIENKWSEGFFISESNKAKLRALIEGNQQGAAA